MIPRYPVVSGFFCSMFWPLFPLCCAYFEVIIPKTITFEQDHMNKVQPNFYFGKINDEGIRKKIMK